MKKGKDLVRVERLEIGILLGKRYSLRSIAREMRRSPNTISYEIRENSVRGRYVPISADTKARLRKRMRRLQWSKIEENPDLRKFVIEMLKARWNPDEIAGYMKRKRMRPYVSKTAIYDWLRTARGERYCAWLYSKRKRVRKRKPKTKRVLIPNRIGIERRMSSATNRTRYGHWERDTITSKKGCSGGLATHQERKGRLIVARVVRTMRPVEHAQATRWVAKIAVMKTATADNGIENRDHEDWGMPTFFCDPYSSWQKGGVENANKMLRVFFPKGTDFSTVTQKQIDDACRIINNKPRKILGYRSALEVALKANIIQNTSVLIQG
jgi:IS30 family transposase